MREASWSLVPVAKWGLRSVGACHQRILSGPPLPRLVGVKTGFFACAWATPAAASIWAAKGAVSPRPTIIWTKARRLSRPWRTSSINSCSFRSSMLCLLRLERFDDGVARGARRGLTADVARAGSGILEGLGHGTLDAVPDRGRQRVLVLCAEPAAHHGRRENRRYRIRDALAG